MKNEEKISEEVYCFEENKGISGILTQSGEFIKCLFADHISIIKKVSKEQENNLLFFSSRMDYTQDSCVYTSSNFLNVSNEQKSWISHNYSYLDNIQKIELFELIEKKKF